MRGELRIEFGGSDVARVAVGTRPLTLGRAPDVDVQIADQRLSRHHCQVELVGDRLMVTDLGSSNGTYVKNQRVQQAVLAAGEAFFIGKTRVVLETIAVAPPAPPAPDPRPMDATAIVERQRVGHSSVVKNDPTPPPRLFVGALAGQPRAPVPPPQADTSPPVFAPVARAPVPTVSAPPPVALAPPHSSAGRAANPGVPAGATSVDRPAPGVGIEPDTVKSGPSPVEGYQILERLGEGSMGQVFLARRLTEGDVCVLKTIKFSGSSKDAIFFIRECQAGMKIKHPSVVDILDFGESSGQLYLAMEYVDGGNLLDWIKGHGPLPSKDALKQMRAIADALIYAGKKKIVHRDIKPANILLSKAGETKLADFGLAKTIQQAGKQGLTQVGETRGTPIYMPPEMLMSASDADQRADIYSLGATYYHAVTGQHPFRAPSVPEILRMVVQSEPVAIEERNPNVDPGLCQVIRKMMRKQPADRYRSAEELAQELDKLAGANS